MKTLANLKASYPRQNFEYSDNEYYHIDYRNNKRQVSVNGVISFKLIDDLMKELSLTDKRREHSLVTVMLNYHRSLYAINSSENYGYKLNSYNYSYKLSLKEVEQAIIKGFHMVKIDENTLLAIDFNRYYNEFECFVIMQDEYNPHHFIVEKFYTGKGVSIGFHSKNIVTMYTPKNMTKIQKFSHVLRSAVESFYKYSEQNFVDTSTKVFSRYETEKYTVNVF